MELVTPINSTKGSHTLLTLFSIEISLHRRWNKTSNELQSQVLSSRSRKKASPHGSAKAASSSGGSVLSRITRFVTGSKKSDESADHDVVPSAPSRKTPARSFGFATTKLSSYSDQNSESLFRYKNISSEYMREISPTREEDEPAAENDLSTASSMRADRFTTRRNKDSPRTDVVRKSRFARKPASDDDDDNEQK